MRYSDKIRTDRASNDVTKSGSSYALVRVRFLTIIGLIGILAGVTLLITTPVTAGTRGGAEKKRWQPLRGEKDILLLRNQPHHVIEGTGAAGMLLGETETELRQRYGAPAYRDNAAPETLHYTEETFNASYVLRNGRIVEIRLEVAKHKSPSLEWFTALGLHESNLAGKDAAQAAPYLQKFYGTRRLRQVGDMVDVYARGIRFRFRGKTVIFVDVMQPVPYDGD